MKKRYSEFSDKEEIISKICHNLKKCNDNPHFNKSSKHSDSPSKKLNFPSIHCSPHHSSEIKVRISPRNSQELPNDKNKLGCLQTISFNKSEFSQTKSIILMNSRRPIGSFLRASARCGQKLSELEDSHIFLSTQKYLHMKKEKSLKKQKKHPQTSSINNEVKVQQKISPEKKQNEIANKESYRSSSSIIDHLATKSKGKEYNLNSLYLKTLSPRKLTKKIQKQRQKEKVENERIKYSPWTSDQAEEIHQIWNQITQ